MAGLIASGGTYAFTSGTPTQTGAFKALGAAVAQFVAARYASPDFMVMTGPRWAWFNAAVDSQNRPLVAPVDVDGSNAFGLGSTGAQGVVGSILGIPVVVDPGTSTNLGTAPTKTPSCWSRRLIRCGLRGRCTQKRSRRRTPTSFRGFCASTTTALWWCVTRKAS